MRALDCAEGHDPIHFSAPTDEELLSQVQDHVAEIHPELTEEEVQGIFSQGVHDE